MKEEKYIKEKLTDYDSPMDMDAMWSNLEKNLDSKKDEKGALWFRGQSFLISLAFIAIGLLLLTFIGDSFQNQNLTEAIVQPIEDELNNKVNPLEQTQTNKENSESQIEGSDVENNELNNQSTLAKSYEQQVQSTTSNIRTTSGLQSTEIKSQPTFNKSANLQSKVADKNISNNQTASSKVLTKEHLTQKQKELPFDNNLSSSSSSLNNLDKLVLEKDALNALPYIKAYIDWTRSKDGIVPEFERGKRIELKSDDKSIWRASINVGQTASFYNFNLANDSELSDLTIDFLNEKNKTTLNNTFGIGLEKVNKKGLKYYLGLNYLNHGFINSQSDTLLGAQSETIVETVIIGDDGSFIGMADSRVEVRPNLDLWSYRDYKTLHTFQMPLMVGYEFRINKFDFSISAGPVLNYIYKQGSNLTFTDEQILYAESRGLFLGELSTEVLDLKSNAFIVSAAMKADLGFAISDHFRVFGSADAGLLFGELVNDPEGILSTNLTHLGLKTGLSYVF